MVLDVPQLIELFGKPNNWNTDSWEAAHKFTVKAHYARGSKRVADLNITTLRDEVLGSELGQWYGLSRSGSMRERGQRRQRFVRNQNRRGRDRQSVVEGKRVSVVVEH